MLIKILNFTEISIVVSVSKMSFKLSDNLLTNSKHSNWSFHKNVKIQFKKKVFKINCFNFFLFLLGKAVRWDVFTNWNFITGTNKIVPRESRPNDLKSPTSDKNCSVDMSPLRETWMEYAWDKMSVLVIAKTSRSKLTPSCHPFATIYNTQKKKNKITSVFSKSKVINDTWHLIANY